MTPQPWGPPPDQWNRGPAPWGNQQRVQFGGQQQWPAPQQGWPQQQGWPAPQPGGFPGRPPQPRRKGPFSALLRAALMIGLIMIAFSILKGVVGFVTDSEAPRPTQTTRPGGGGTTTTGPGQPGGNTGTGTSQYQNEGYQAPPADFDPPELPIPTTVSQAESWLANNRAYAQNVPSPTRCELPAMTIDSSTGQLEDAMNELMGCLMAVWEPPLKAAGFEMPRPPVTVYTSPVTTACGTMKEVNAAYCAADQRVYYAKRLLSALPSQVGRTKYAAENVIAHEFAHAVQARTGILIADKALEQRASKADARVMSRRTELQADCMAGLYVQSVAQSQNMTNTDLQNLVNMNYYLGDDALSGQPNIDGDHGLGRSRQAWFAKGLQTNQISACNSWTVPAAQVR